MHFAKLFTTIVVIAITGAIASSPTREEGSDLAEINNETELNVIDGGINGVPCDEADMENQMDDQTDNFSPAPRTSLELGGKRICYFGPCLRRHSVRRRCAKGYQVLGYKRCGWWRVRALCCRRLGRLGRFRHRRRRHRWGDNQLEGDEAEVESSEEKLDELDD